MRELEPPDIHFLSAALGWIELGLPQESHAELARLSPGARCHPDVLSVEWNLCEHENRWQDAYEVASRIVEIDRERTTGWINRSYALHALRRTAEASAALIPAVALFPSNGIIPYNLACYACQLNRLPEARQWLRKAMALEGRDTILLRARTDEDLEPMLAELEIL
jgi:Flp pilus assembly protein TadD